MLLNSDQQEQKRKLSPNVLRPDFSTPDEMDTLVDEKARRENRDDSVVDVIGAGIARENFIVSKVLEEGSVSDEKQEGYNPYDGLEEEYYGYSDMFQDVVNEAQSSRVKTQIENEIMFNDILDNNGWLGDAARMLGGLSNPTTLLPFAGANKILSASTSTLKGAGIGGLSMAGVVFGEEVLLHDSQMTRTKAESIAAVATVGVIGAGVGGVLSRMANVQRAKLDQIDDEVIKGFVDDYVGGSVGAAAVDTRTKAGQELVGSGKLAEATDFVYVNQRVAQSGSLPATKVVEDMVNTPFLREKNLEGVKTEISVEENIKNWNGAREWGLIKVRDGYKAYLKRMKAEKQKPISQSEFNIEVGRYNAYGKADVPEAAEAGKYFEEAYYGKIKKDLDELGITDPESKRNYLNRVYLRDRIIDGTKNENGESFHQVIENHILEQVRDLDNLRDKALLRSDEITETLAKQNENLPMRVEETKVLKAELKAAKKSKSSDDVIQGLERRIEEKEAATRFLKKEISKNTRLAEKMLAKNDYYIELSAVGDDLTEIVDSAVNNILGNKTGVFADGVVPLERGSMKSLLLDIEDSKIEFWLDRDIKTTTGAYQFGTVPTVEMTKKFGSADLKKQIDDIVADFDAKIRETEDPKERRKLEKQKKATVRDVEALRDMSLGTYKQWDNPDSIIARSAEGIKKLNFLTMLGSMALSAIPDMVNTITAFGLSTYMSTGAKVMAQNLNKIGRANLREVRDVLVKVGSITDLIGAGRLQQIGDIGRVGSKGTKAEQALDYMTDGFGKVTLMAHWNTYWKSFNGMFIQDVILSSAKKIAKGKTVSKKHMIAMARMGVDENDLRKIAVEYGTHGRQSQGVVAKAKGWLLVVWISGAIKNLQELLRQL